MAHNKRLFHSLIHDDGKQTTFFFRWTSRCSFIIGIMKLSQFFAPPVPLICYFVCVCVGAMCFEAITFFLYGLFIIFTHNLFVFRSRKREIFLPPLTLFHSTATPQVKIFITSINSPELEFSLLVRNTHTFCLTGRQTHINIRLISCLIKSHINKQEN